MLIGKYRVERVIGKGGMGVVVEAYHLALRERFALKFLLPELATNHEHAERFQREAQASVRIKSEHVARVSDVGTLDTGAPYMVMELLTGQDLAEALHEHGPLPLQDAVDYVIQGCEAIAEAHALGIVHRDLKPSNLFLTARTDGSPLVKVLDFGISKLLHDRVENLTRTEAAMGSALYMSPEQMQQTRSVDHRTDIYAIGVSLFELCAGRPPYFAQTLPQLCAEVLTGTPTPLRQLRPDLPESFAAALARAYARDRDQRYTSVAELVLALAPFAPPRSRPSIERIARMAGLSIPEAAPAYRAPLPSSPSYQAPAASPAPAAQPMTALEPRFATATTAPHVVTPIPAPGRGEQILPGPYAGPVSSRAAATFKSGAATGALNRPRIPAAAIVAMFASALTVGAVVGLVVLRSGASAPDAVPEPVAASPSPSPAPTPVPTIATAPTAPELEPASSAVPEVRPATDTTSSAATPPSAAPPPRPTHKPGPPRPAPAPRSTRGVDLNNPN